MEAILHPVYSGDLDETGQITHWAYTYADNYNYSYDVIDPLGERCSNRLAMLWRNDRGEEKRLTFGALKTLEHPGQSFFKAGAEKGDVIMTALRTHWSYWWWLWSPTGWVRSLPPTTCSPKRTSPFGCKKANVRCVITCRESQAEARVLAAAEEAGVPPCALPLGGGDGFEDFLGKVAVRRAPVMDRVETRWSEPILLYFTSGTTGQPGGAPRPRLHPGQPLGGALHAGHPRRVPPLRHRRY